MGKAIAPYDHDCDVCIWVNWIHFNGAWANMYYCPGPALHVGNGSVVIRRSSEPGDYWSTAIGVCAKGSIGVGG